MQREQLAEPPRRLPVGIENLLACQTVHQPAQDDAEVLAQAERHWGLACVVRLDSTSRCTSRSSRSGKSSTTAMGTGASRIIDPFPLA